MLSIFQCQHDCLLHEETGDFHEYSQGRGQLASVTWHAKYWTHQVAQEMGGHLNIALHCWEELTCWPLISGPQLICLEKEINVNSVFKVL